MIHWSQRLVSLQGMKGGSWRTAAKLAEVEYDSLMKWKRGEVDNPRGEEIERLADYYGVTPEFLRYGTLGSTDENRVPLLTENEVGTMAPSQNLRDVWGGVSMTVVPRSLGKNVFSLVISDDACAPKFERGDTVICDADRDPNPGQFVIAKVNGIGKGILRKFKPKDALNKSHFVLSSLNSDYPDITVTGPRDGFVVGLVIQVIKDV